MRSHSREAVFKYLFAKFFNNDNEGLFAFIKKDFQLNDKDGEFADSLLSALESNFDDYLEKINDLSVDYKDNRIFIADKCAILIGMAEYDNFKETPKAVIIDEAVNLAQKYSTEKSTDYVNGILAAYINR